MKKRFLSVVLCLCMVVGMVPAIIPAASAYATGDDYPYHVGIKEFFVDEWNFYKGECTSFVAWCLNSRNGIRFTNQYMGVGRWGNAGDWKGVAQRLGITVDMNPAVGAVAWKAATSAFPTGHVAWVSAVNGNSITIEEYNQAVWFEGDWWGDHKYHTRTVDKSSFDGYIHIKDIGGSSTPAQSTATAQNIGSDFYAYISYPNGNLNLENRNNNVQTATKKASDPRQIWHFVWDGGRNAYSIINMYNGLYLDSCYGTAGTNVQVLEDTEEYIPAKRWQICGSASKCYLTAIYRNDHQYVLDVDNASTASGTNVQMWDRNGTPAQTFQINKISNIGGTIGYNMGTDFYAQISYNGAYLQTTGGKIPDGSGYGIDVRTTRTSNTSSPNQIWHFMRQSNGSYKIVNMGSGWCLDAQTGIAANGKNIWTWWDDHGDVPERWYIFYSAGDSSYRLMSAINYPWTGERNLYSIDLHNASGEKVQLWQQNRNAWQYFKITKVSYNPAPVTTPSYIITAKANPSEGGTVTGGGSYANGKSATVKATANSGYTFKGWTENGNTVSTSASYTLTVNASRTLTAVFEKNGAVLLTVKTAPTASAITYGQTLMDSKLTGGNVIDSSGKTISGFWRWDEWSSKPTATGQYKATFAPVTEEYGSIVYSSASAQVSVTVNKADIKLTAPAAVTIKSGQKLSECALTGGSAVDLSGNTVSGSWSWKSPDTVPASGSYQAVFTPNMSEAYNIGTVNVSVTVTEEQPTCVNGHTWETWTVSTAPTCTQAGQQVHTCTKCGKQETETIAALGHNYQLSGGSSVCTRCGDVRGGGTTGGLNNFKRTYPYYAGMFSDVASNAWYAGNVSSVCQFGLMNGVAESRFAPSSNVTYAQAITMAARIHSIYYNGEESFKSYDGGNWFDPYVNYARANSICTDNYSNYNAPATREEFVHILANALPEAELVKMSGKNLNFADAGSIVYSGDVELLYGAGIINGFNGNGTTYFKPGETVTRAQAAAIITRMVQPDLRV